MSKPGEVRLRNADGAEHADPINGNLPVSANSVIAYSNEQASLSDGSEIDSGWLDCEKVDKVQISARASSAGMTIVISSRATDGGSELVTPVTYTDGPFYLANIICRQRYMRFQWQNNTGSGVTDAILEIKQTFGSSDKLSVFPVGIQPSDFSQAALVQSVTRGLSPEGSYEAVGVNKVGAILTSDFGTEVARNLYSGYSIDTKFGRNPDVDTGSTPEDMWNGGSDYTGFNATSAETLEVFSADADDQGLLVSSGTATGGSSTTLIDSGATFVSNGAASGDIVLNDTKGVHGIIDSVDSETQITVYRMTDSGTSPSNESGDTYRIANANDSGAAVVKLSSLLDGDLVSQTPEYIILDGTAGVNTTGSYMRCPRAKVVLAGSSGLNEGTITVRQSSTTANIMAVMPTFGQTTIGAFTVPSGKICVLKRFRASITRTSGAAGSATILFTVRERGGGAWNAKRVFEIQTGGALGFSQEGGIILAPGTDFKFRIHDVSDNSTVCESAVEYYLIDE